MLFLELVRIFVTWLLIASLIGMLVKRLKMPYTVGLVLIGLVLEIIIPLARARPGMISPEDMRTFLIPNLILSLLVPPLVFEAAFHVDSAALRKGIKSVLTFAVPGVALTMVLVGGVVAWGTDLPLAVALVFGALIAATDPVAVVALFRSLGAPKKLLVLLEGESLFNDGTAIVLFHAMLGIVASGEFRLVRSLIDFIKVAAGGVLVGALIGWLISQLLKRVDDHLIEISLSLVAAYGSYLFAESFHLSGVLGVVAAGIFSGNVGARAMSEATKEKLIDFWEYAAFLANSFVFLIIGLMIDLGTVANNLGAILLAILAVLLARAVVIYGLSHFFKDIESSTKHVLFWGGLRGAISLALALSLTVEGLGPGLEVLQAMAFGIVLFTLLVQGTTMASLLRRLKLVGAGVD
jgi:CPA1 family monovalent cation:H+ antiporter